MTSTLVVVLTARQPIVPKHFLAHSVLDDVTVVDVIDVGRLFSYTLNSPFSENAWTDEKPSITFFKNNCYLSTILKFF